MKIKIVFKFILFLTLADAAEPEKPSYLWEYVPSLAQASSYAATGLGFAGAAGVTVYAAHSMDTIDFNNYLNTGLLISAVAIDGAIGAVAGAYIGKKTGQVAYPYLKRLFNQSRIGQTIIAASSFTWKMFQYVWNMKNYTEDHIRREYLQGTVFALNVDRPA